MKYQSLIKRIKKNEGFSIKPYRDQLGFFTIGYGHLILFNETNLIEKKINKEKLEKIFVNDFNSALKNYNLYLSHIVCKKKYSELLIEMIFQMGIKKVLKFKNLLNFISVGKEYSVCFEMMNSLWYKQTPSRVKSLINTLLKNE